MDVNLSLSKSPVVFGDVRDGHLEVRKGGRENGRRGTCVKEVEEIVRVPRSLGNVNDKNGEPYRKEV